MMTFQQAMEFQANFCTDNGAPITARVCRALGRVLDDRSATGRRVREWPNDYVRDAVPLRLVAPFHALYREKACDALVPLFEGGACDDVAAISAAVAAHDAWISPWLDGPPQTNEPARSATFMAALLALAARFGRPFELLEIGSSAGLNLLIDRYRYRLGGVDVGPDNASVVIAPEWRGSPPPHAQVEITAVRGVDIAPVDVRDPQAAARLAAYAWIDAPERVARIEAATAMIQARAVDLATGDAADWVEHQLAQPQVPGTARVLMHSVVWPYLDEARRTRILAALDRAALHATADQPLAWLRMEWDSAHTPHRIRLRYWPKGDDVLLGSSHPHGAWIDWTG